MGVIGILTEMYAYLEMTIGKQAGSVYGLREDTENQIGRSCECDVAIRDPLCSPIHAIVKHDGGQWRLCDAGSHHGSYINGQRVEDALLEDSVQIRIGSTEFLFHLCADLSAELRDDRTWVQTLLKDQAVDSEDTEEVTLGALHDDQRMSDLLVLYQLSIRLLGSVEPDEVIRIALELVHEHIAASEVGFLRLTETGELVPQVVVPAHSTEPVGLNTLLTEMVCRDGRAVWVANERVQNLSQGTEHFSDAICVPLLHRENLCGVIHICREQEHFSQRQFDFSMSVANILTVALLRAQQASSLKIDYWQLAAKSPGHDEMIGQCDLMLELKLKIQKFSKATGCVLVRGESGTGKELVARAIQRNSPRVDKPFLTINCAAMPSELIESQLFGHKAGAFTGADRDHLGFFQHADLGTLFLDEVGELSLEGQAKLLRILEGHPFLPVGSSEEIRVDVRVIAATNQDLEALVREHRFREDLYYRLGVFQIDVPPLRQRGGDVALLVESLLDHYRHEHGRLGLKMAAAARRKLLEYHWPGNVRQLRNAIDSAVVLATEAEITADDFPLRDIPEQKIETLSLSSWEQRLIRRALDRSSGNVASAAKLLGIGRATLYRKLDTFRIER